CWIAASLLKHKVDRKESIELAKRHLDFSCKEEEANYVYSKLRVLKKMFLSWGDNIKESASSQDHIATTEDIKITKEPLDAGESQLEEDAFKLRMAKGEMLKSIRRVQRKCEKRMTKLLRKQHEEIQEFHRFWEEKRLQLEKEHRVESAFVRSIHQKNSMQMDKLKMVDNEFAEKMEEHKHQKDICFKDLEAKHLTARDEEKHKVANWLAEIKSSTSEGTALDELPLHGSECRNKVGYSRASELGACNGLENVAHVPEHLTEQIPDRIVHSTLLSCVAPTDITKTLPNEALGYSIPADTGSTRVSVYDDDVETMATGRVSVDRMEQPDRVGNSTASSENIACVNPPSSEEQPPDGVQSILRGEDVPSEVPETVLNEVVGDVDAGEIGSPAVVTNGENEGGNKMSYDVSNALRIHSDGANDSFNTESPFLGPSLIELPSVQPVGTPACDDLLPQYLEHDACSPASICIEIGVQDETLHGNQSTLEQGLSPLQPVDDGPIDQSNHHAPLLEPLDRLHESQCNDTSVGQNQCDLSPANRLAREPCSEGHISFQNAEASFQLAGNQAELSDMAASRTGANFEVHPQPDATQLPLGNNQPNLSSTSRVQNQPSGELHASFQNADASPLVDEVRAELPNRAVLPADANLSITQGFNNFLAQSARQAASRMPPTPLYADPLQNELERLRKETEQAVKVHEETKVRLKSECDKEIEEIIAQIRSKYEAKLQEAEAAFLLKKNIFDTNHNKVLMNKILAEAFRSKCVDLRSTGSLGMPQAMPSGLMQHRHQSSLQPTPRPLVNGSYPAGQAAASQQITPLSPQLHHSAALFASIMTRPPHISPITPSTVRVAGEIRAPAPHIQPFRPASMSTASFTSLTPGIPCQPAPNNLPATSPSHTQLPPPPSSLPTNHSGLCSRPPQPENAGGLPAHNLSLSATEMLMDIDSRSGAHQPDIMPPLADFSTTFDSLDLSEFGASGSMQVSSAPSAVVADVVCLSDDD
ncbi:unnamed protein product, partial [Ilex paraguariensis]